MPGAISLIVAVTSQQILTLYVSTGTESRSCDCRNQTIALINPVLSATAMFEVAAQRDCSKDLPIPPDNARHKPRILAVKPW